MMSVDLAPLELVSCQAHVTGLDDFYMMRDEAGRLMLDKYKREHVVKQVAHHIADAYRSKLTVRTPERYEFVNSDVSKIYSLTLMVGTREQFEDAVERRARALAEGTAQTRAKEIVRDTLIRVADDAGTLVTETIRQLAK